MKSFKKTAVFLLTLAICLLLSSCIDGATARGTINDMFYAVEKQDYRYAEEFLHPDRPADLEKFFTSIETNEGVDFQEGIMIERYSSVKSSYYDSSVGGSLYATTAELKIGNHKASAEIEIVDNDAGYGIYNIDLDIDE